MKIPPIGQFASTLLPLALLALRAAAQEETSSEDATITSIGTNDPTASLTSTTTGPGPISTVRNTNIAAPPRTTSSVITIVTVQRYYMLERNDAECTSLFRTKTECFRAASVFNTDANLDPISTTSTTYFLRYRVEKTYVPADETGVTYMPAPTGVEPWGSNAWIVNYGPVPSYCISRYGPDRPWRPEARSTGISMPPELEGIITPISTETNGAYIATIYDNADLGYLIPVRYYMSETMEETCQRFDPTIPSKQDQTKRNIQIAIIVICTVIGSLIIIGFFESYRNFRNMMLGRPYCRGAFPLAWFAIFGVAPAILGFLVRRRNGKTEPLELDVQQRLQERYRQLSIGRMTKLWLTHIFAGSKPAVWEDWMADIGMELKAPPPVYQPAPAYPGIRQDENTISSGAATGAERV